MTLVKLWKKSVNRKSSKKPKVKKTKAKPAKKTVKKSKTKPAKKVSKKIKSVKKKSRPVKIVPAKLKEREVGIVTHYFGKIQVGIIKVKTTLKVGDKIHIKGAHDDFSQSIQSMQYEHESISTAKKGLEIGIKVIKPVHENDRVYKQSE